MANKHLLEHRVFQKETEGQQVQQPPTLTCSAQGTQQLQAVTATGNSPANLPIISAPST